MKVIDYVVFSAEGTGSLTAAVKERIKEGWTPIGGMTVEHLHINGGAGYYFYHQAMVKYEPEAL